MKVTVSTNKLRKQILRRNGRFGSGLPSCPPGTTGFGWCKCPCCCCPSTIVYGTCCSGRTMPAALTATITSGCACIDIALTLNQTDTTTWFGSTTVDTRPCTPLGSLTEPIRLTLQCSPLACGGVGCNTFLLSGDPGGCITQANICPQAGCACSPIHFVYTATAAPQCCTGTPGATITITE